MKADDLPTLSRRGFVVGAAAVALGTAIDSPLIQVPERRVIIGPVPLLYAGPVVEKMTTETLANDASMPAYKAMTFSYSQEVQLFVGVAAAPGVPHWFAPEFDRVTRIWENDELAYDFDAGLIPYELTYHDQRVTLHDRKLRAYQARRLPKFAIEVAV